MTPSTREELELANNIVAQLKACDVPASSLWAQAAHMFNKEVLQRQTTAMTDSGSQVSPHVRMTNEELLRRHFDAVGRANFTTQYINPESSKSAQVPGRPGASAVRQSADMRAASITLDKVDVTSRNKCRDAIRRLGGTCANSASVHDVRARLKELLSRQAQTETGSGSLVGDQSGGQGGCGCDEAGSTRDETDET